MATPNHAEFSNDLDSFLHNMIKNGVQVLNAAGEVVTVSPTAAMIREARQRLRDLGITQQVKPGSNVAKLAEAMRARGMKYGGSLPPVPSADEEAA